MGTSVWDAYASIAKNARFGLAAATSASGSAAPIHGVDEIAAGRFSVDAGSSGPEDAIHTSALHTMPGTKTKWMHWLIAFLWYDP